ncbi:MAG: hypothetical protein F2712_04630 [Actinobacteria bacterium]|uniref:Unannotated protein n=1 Tax=freshwater metagenome TaxID=449393 RepID=A0A6J6UXS8_9ZZZZ|nr:hypothetical protein [Actinomycetota bacterium]
MNIRSIFNKSLFSICLLLGTVGCSSSTSDSGDDTQSEATSELTSDETSDIISAADEVVEISVIIGQTSGSAVAYQATLGSTVRLKILNPDADDEFHLHGYDLESGVTPAGQEAIIEFTADKLGTFDLESHVTSEWILTLVVEE